MVVRKTSHAVAEALGSKIAALYRGGYWADLVVIDRWSSTDNPGDVAPQMRMVSPLRPRILSGSAVDMTLVNGHVVSGMEGTPYSRSTACHWNSVASHYLFCSGLTASERRRSTFWYYYSGSFPARRLRLITILSSRRLVAENQ